MEVLAVVKTVVVAVVVKGWRGHCHVSWSVVIDVLINVVNEMAIALGLAVST